MSNLAEQQSELPEVMNSVEAAAYLRLVPKTVRTMAKEGRLPGKKVGTEWRFLKTKLEQWLSGDYSVAEQKPEGVLSNKENKPCRSLSVVTPTGSILGTMDADYEEALGLKS